MDLVLLSGDIANMPMDFDLPLEDIDKYTKDMEKMINSIASIQPNMYYIPGNVSKQAAVHVLSYVAVVLYC